MKSNTQILDQKQSISGMMNCLLSVVFLLFGFYPSLYPQEPAAHKKVDGYRGIWFELNQKYEYGDKYSGALGTYTAKHTPLAIYSKEVNKTFFVYGGTKSAKQRYLLCMIGEFDHGTEKVSKPTIVHDKNGVDDPHDNPSLLLDDKGYIWVFVSGRGKQRPGYKYKSTKPYDISSFEQITEEEMTYPQPWFTQHGFFNFFTKYEGVRQLFFESSKDGAHWTEDRLLAAIPESRGERSGHYQVSGTYQGKKAGTFFNRHPEGNVDRRTDLYYVESTDFGKSWKNAKGKRVKIPMKKKRTSARVINYAKAGKNVYMKDLAFDKYGNPACLYIRSNGFEPGPSSVPYEWCITKWNGKNWQTTVITTSDHNYDMGSLYIEHDRWMVAGPTEIGPQQWGVGGEIALWSSTDQGNSWSKTKVITKNSQLSHSYVRKPVNYQPPFVFFWADGDSHSFSQSHLYFGDWQGNVWQLPYEMQHENEAPLKIN
tara:strand:+ start:682 stop:2127 length:1446 start_codon:yes stop_codon:yes gene_type:complete